MPGHNHAHFDIVVALSKIDFNLSKLSPARFCPVSPFFIILPQHALHRINIPSINIQYPH
jgi:hypothetical protein